MNATGTQLRDPIKLGTSPMAYGDLNKQIDAAVELGKNPVSKHQIQPQYGDGRDGTAESVSRDQILRCERRRQAFFFPCFADHEQDWQL